VGRHNNYASSSLDRIHDLSEGHPVDPLQDLKSSEILGSDRPSTDTEDMRIRSGPSSPLAKNNVTKIGPRKTHRRRFGDPIIEINNIGSTLISTVPFIFMNERKTPN